MGSETVEGQLAAKVLDEYMKGFQERILRYEYLQHICIWMRQRRIFILILSLML